MRETKIENEVEICATKGTNKIKCISTIAMKLRKILETTSAIYGVKA
jgi:hypothetical protein